MECCRIMQNLMKSYPEGHRTLQNAVETCRIMRKPAEFHGIPRNSELPSPGCSAQPRLQGYPARPRQPSRAQAAQAMECPGTLLCYKKERLLAHSISCFKSTEVSVTSGRKMRRSARLQACQGPPQPPTTTSRRTQAAPPAPPCPSTTSGARQVPLQPPTSRTRQAMPPGPPCPPSSGTRHGASTGPTLPGTLPQHPGPSPGTRQAAPSGGSYV